MLPRWSAYIAWAAANAIVSSADTPVPWSKPGLSWPNALWVPIGGFTGRGSRVSSYYNWSPWPLVPPKDASPVYDVPFDFVPMLWGCTDTYTGPFQAAVAANFSSVRLTPDCAILGFNEPDIAGQALCSPRDAAQAWKAYMEPLKQKGFRLGAPAVGNGPDGKKWLLDWYEVCGGGCNPDFTTVHWYGLDAGDFIRHIKDYYNTFQKPIWVTEYAMTDFLNPTATAQLDLTRVQIFMDVTSAFINSVDWVERYFWFGAMYEMQGVNELNGLFDMLNRQRSTRSGALSSLGVQYAGSNGSVSTTRRPKPSSSGADRTSDKPSSSAVLIVSSLLLSIKVLT